MRADLGEEFSYPVSGTLGEEFVKDVGLVEVDCAERYFHLAYRVISGEPVVIEHLQYEDLILQF